MADTEAASTGVVVVRISVKVSFNVRGKGSPLAEATLNEELGAGVAIALVVAPRDQE
jgi:hypothetical protein